MGFGNLTTSTKCKLDPILTVFSTAWLELQLAMNLEVHDLSDIVWRSEVTEVKMTLENTVKI